MQSDAAFSIYRHAFTGKSCVSRLSFMNTVNDDCMHRVYSLLYRERRNTIHPHVPYYFLFVFEVPLGLSHAVSLRPYIVYDSMLLPWQTRYH